MGAGCSAPAKSGQSGPQTAVIVTKDEEDLDLAPMILDRTSIPEFDTVFEQMEALLAQFITWNNAINDYATNVQNLLLPTLGAVFPDVVVAKNVDMLHIDFVTPFNRQRAHPQHHVIMQWVKSKEVSKADTAVALARHALLRYTASTRMQVHLKLMESPAGHVTMNILQGDVPESEDHKVQAVNRAVEGLQRAVGLNFGVLMSVTTAAAKLRGKTVFMQLYKLKDKDAQLEFEANLAPVTLVDIFKSGVADAILKVERSVAVVGNELAKVSQKYDPPLSIQEQPKYVRKLRTLPAAPEYEEVNAAIRNINAVLFKMNKVCAQSSWVTSTPLSAPEPNFPELPMMICEALKRVADATWTICKSHLDSVHLVTLLTHHEPFTITPNFTHTDTTFRFDLDVVMDQALLMDKGFPDFLPMQVRTVWDALLALQAVVQEAVNTLTPLRHEYEVLLDEAREFSVLAPDAGTQRGLSMAEAARATQSTLSNLNRLFDAEDGVFGTFQRNVHRIILAYAKAAKEIKSDLQAKLAELTSKLPRTLHKPNFSPELLAIAQKAISPAEMAATMSLAIAAGSGAIDPATLALKQQQIALTGSVQGALHHHHVPAPGYGSAPGAGLQGGTAQGAWGTQGTGWGQGGVDQGGLHHWGQQGPGGGGAVGPGQGQGVGYPGMGGTMFAQPQVTGGQMGAGWGAGHTWAGATGVGAGGMAMQTHDPAIANLWSQYGGSAAQAIQQANNSKYTPSRLGGAAAASAVITNPLSTMPQGIATQQ